MPGEQVLLPTEPSPHADTFYPQAVPKSTVAASHWRSWEFAPWTLSNWSLDPLGNGLSGFVDRKEAQSRFLVGSIMWDSSVGLWMHCSHLWKVMVQLSFIDVPFLSDSWSVTYSDYWRASPSHCSLLLGLTLVQMKGWGQVAQELGAVTYLYALFSCFLPLWESNLSQIW